MVSRILTFIVHYDHKYCLLRYTEIEGLANNTLPNMKTVVPINMACTFLSVSTNIKEIVKLQSYLYIRNDVQENMKSPPLLHLLLAIISTSF